MSGRRPARTRLIGALVLALVAALATFAVVITLRYRDGLEQRLRTDLTSGAGALRAARTPTALKAVIASLAGEGISVDFAGISGNGGSLQSVPRGSASERARARSRSAAEACAATLTGSRTGIDRQVRSLEVTEAIGGVIALALLAALARALVLLDRAARRSARIRGDEANVSGRRIARTAHAGRRASRDRRAAPARSATASGARRDRSPTRPRQRSPRPPDRRPLEPRPARR